MMQFRTAPLRRPIVKYVDYVDVQDALRGSTAEQQEAAVRVCAGLLGIDEAKALKVDPKVSLPAFWTLLQYRGLNQSEKGLASSRLEKLKQASPELFAKAVQIMADVISNPELYPWSLTDAELTNMLSANNTMLTGLKVLGWSSLSGAAVAGSFVKGFKQSFASLSAKAVLQSAAKDYTIAAIVLKGYATALDAAASAENLEKVRCRERAAAEKEGNDVVKRTGTPAPNMLELGPAPITRAW
jgi:hypothetical protein